MYLVKLGKEKVGGKFLATVIKAIGKVAKKGQEQEQDQNQKSNGAVAGCFYSFPPFINIFTTPKSEQHKKEAAD